MAETPPVAGGGLLVTVVAGERRMDLAVPERLPVAELVPELARGLGVADDPAAASYDVVLGTVDGRHLEPQQGLAAQQVRDGAVLVLRGVGPPRRPRRYDDLAEAVADLAPQLPGGLLEPAGRHRGTAVVLGVVLLAVALVGVLRAPAWPSGPGLAALVAAAGVAAATLCSRLPVTAAPTLPAVVPAWLGAAAAGVAGALLGQDVAGPGAGAVLLGGGAGLFLAGTVTLAAMRRERLLALLPVLSGTWLVACGAITTASVPVSVVAPVAVTLLVALSQPLPRWALSLAGVRAGTDEVDVERVLAGLHLAEQLAVAVTAMIGLALVLVAPVAVRVGAWGALWAVLACLVQLVRHRDVRLARVARCADLGSALGLLALTVSVLALRPGWTPALVVLAAAVGVLLLAGAAVPGDRGAGGGAGGRAAGVAHRLALVGLLPALVLAVDLPGLMTGW